MNKNHLAILSTAAPAATISKVAALLPGGFWQLVTLAWTIMNILGSSWPTVLGIIDDIAVLLKDPAGFDWQKALDVLGADLPKAYAVVVLIAAALGITLPPMPPGAAKA